MLRLVVLSALRISTHSLTRRLTEQTLFTEISPLYFNSQPHKEADRLLISYYSIYFRISTHSLTRRLTTGFQFISNVFNISTHSLTRSFLYNKKCER